jgi:hypothetical protein
MMGTFNATSDGGLLETASHKAEAKANEVIFSARL